jgi:hypothetical protein
VPLSTLDPDAVTKATQGESGSSSGDEDYKEEVKEEVKGGEGGGGADVKTDNPLAALVGAYSDGSDDERSSSSDDAAAAEVPPGTSFF